MVTDRLLTQAGFALAQGFLSMDAIRDVADIALDDLLGPAV